jgi:hypothetical protein
MKINYEDPEVVARQNIAPNAGCDIDGVFYDMRNCVHLLNEQANRIEELKAKLAKAVDALDWIGNHMVMSMALNEDHLCRMMKQCARTLAELKGETDA